MELKVKAVLETKISSKTNKEYKVLNLTFSNGYTKTIFLDNSETFMLSALEK